MSFLDEKIKTEITAIVMYFNMWFSLSWYDIKQRYRRSFIGPFWITFSTGVMVSGIGLMFSVIFKSPIEEFLPYFAVGQVVWLFIATQINESCSTFVEYQLVIKQMSVPLSVHILRKLWNNLILFGHNFLIIIIVLLIFDQKISWRILYAIPAFGLILFLLFLLSMTLGIICTRFRDITQIVTVFMQLIYFFTPIFWMKNKLPDEYSWISDLNPFYHMIEIVRAPLLGQAPAGMLWVYMLTYIAIAAIMALNLLRLCRHRVPYWL